MISLWTKFVKLIQALSENPGYYTRADRMGMPSVLCWGWDYLYKSAGKEVQMVLNDVVPVNMRHLEGSKQIAQEIDGCF